jgi:hypothetical protein
MAVEDAVQENIVQVTRREKPIVESQEEDAAIKGLIAVINYLGYTSNNLF